MIDSWDNLAEFCIFLIAKMQNIFLICGNMWKMWKIILIQTIKTKNHDFPNDTEIENKSWKTEKR